MNEPSVVDRDPHALPAVSSKPHGLVGDLAPTPVLTEMSLAELHQSGILWWINKALLWDLGLALAVEADPLRPGEGENSRRYTRLFVTDHTPPQRIVDLTSDQPQWEAFQRWLAVRVGTIR